MTSGGEPFGGCAPLVADGALGQTRPTWLWVDGYDTKTDMICATLRLEAQSEG